MSSRPHRLSAALALCCAAFVRAAGATPDPFRVPVPADPSRTPAAAKQEKSAPDYGTSGLSFVQVGAAAFTPLNSGVDYTTTGDGYHDQILRKTTGSFVYFGAPVQIPSGAIVKYLELDYCDESGGTGYVQGALVDSDYHGAELNYVFLASDGDGCTYASKDTTSSNIVVDNYTHHYWLIGIVSDAPGFNVGLAGMIVGYQLQVSAPPGTATFNDVPTNHPFFQFVEALVDAGITAGCGNGNYCPDSPLTRGQMAVFLSKALGLNFH
jgi:hypothetical protein